MTTEATEGAEDAPVTLGATTVPEEQHEPAGGQEAAVDTRVPAVDVVRDVVAAVALVAALALPWTVTAHAADRVEAVLSLVVALLALPLPYLARAGALPKGWSLATTRTVRLWAAVPFVVVTVVYLLLDAFSGDDVRGVGTGLGLGLAGVLLVAQPRLSELGPRERDEAPARLWRRVLAALTALVVLAAVVSFVLFLADAPALGGNDVLLAVCSLLVVGTLGVLPAVGLLRGDAAWRPVVVGLGIALAVLFLVGAGGVRGLVTVQSFHGLGFGALFVPAQAAVAAGAAFARTLGRPAVVAQELPDEAPASSGTEASALETSSELPAAEVAQDAPAGTPDGVEVPRGVVTRALGVLALLGLFTAVTSAATMGQGARGAAVVTTLVVTALVGVLAGLAWLRVQSAAGPVDGAALTVLVTVGAVVLGTVAVVVDTQEGAGVPTPLALVAYGLPGVLLFVLVGAAGRAWWAKTRDLSAGASGAYTWVERPRATPRVTLSPLPVAAPGSSADAGPEAVPGAAGYPVEEPVHAAPAQTAPLYARPAPQVAPFESAAPFEPAAHAEPVEQPATPEPADQDPAQTAVLPAAIAEAGFTAAEAADPQTSLETLAQIAEHAPSLRPFVAANPATYDALLEWLGGLGDPAVDEALASRRS